MSDDLQFGFKHGLGCNEAIFALRTTVSHFTAAGSSVYLGAFDIRKAFDSVHHDNHWCSRRNSQHFTPLVQHSACEC